MRMKMRKTSYLKKTKFQRDSLAKVTPWLAAHRTTVDSTCVSPIFVVELVRHHVAAVPRGYKYSVTLSTTLDSCYIYTINKNDFFSRTIILVLRVSNVFAKFRQSHLLAWLRGTVGRTSVFDRRTFPVLRSTCSWWVTTYVGKPSAVGQPTRPTQPFILSG